MRRHISCFAIYAFVTKETIQHISIGNGLFQTIEIVLGSLVSKFSLFICITKARLGLRRVVRIFNVAKVEISEGFWYLT